jgi:alanine racemase
MSRVAAPVTAPVTAPVRLIIDPDAIRHNTATFVELTRTPVMAVVKGDGYGHGAETMARAALAGGATWLGVTSVENAIQLRHAGLTAPTLSWLNAAPVDFDAATAHSIDVAVATLEELRCAARARSVPRLHLLLDTGMSREGLPPSTWLRLAEYAARAEREGRIRVAGVMSHLASADRPGAPENERQRRSFALGLRLLQDAGLNPGEKHLAGSAAALLDPAARGTLVRIGAGLAGIDASGSADLRWAMTLSARVIEVRRVVAGTRVGYHGTWTADQDTTLGLLPVGYADGVPRAASRHAHVSVAGRRAPVAGLISMNEMVVDLGPDSAVRVGDEATVMGTGQDHAPTVADWATWSDTIPHDVMTALGHATHSSVITRTEKAIR